MKKLSIVLLALLAVTTLAMAANDPGHDSLYVEEQGSSELNGTFNVTENQTIKGGELEISNQFKIRGDGNDPASNLNYIVSDHQSGISINTKGVNGVLRLQDQAANGLVQLGSGSSFVDLNVSNNLYTLGSDIWLGSNFLIRNNGNTPSTSINSLVVNGTGNQMWLTSNKITLGEGTTTGTVFLGKSGLSDSVLLNVTGDLVVQGSTGTIGGSDICTVSNGLCAAGNGTGTAGGWNDTGSTVELITTSDNVDANTLYVDNTNGEVGIGTSNPGSTLDVTGDLQLQSGTNINEFSTDTTLGGSSNNAIPTENAIKTYVDNQVSGSTTSGWNDTGSTVEIITTSDDVDANTLYIDNTNSEIGIGTTNPNANLHVDGSASKGRISITNDNSGITSTDGININLNTAGTDSTIWNYESGYLRFGTNNDEKMRIESGGNVGIGTTTPDEKLEVNGNINVTTGNDICIQGGNCLSTVGTGGTLWTNTSGNATYTDGNVGIGTNFPSAKLQVTGEIWALDSGSDNRFLIGDSGSTGQYAATYWDSTNDDLIIEHSSSFDQIVLDGNGNVGIGSTDPPTKLHVNGNINVTTGNDICIEGGNCLSTVGGNGWSDGGSTVSLSTSSDNIDANTLFVDNSNSEVGIGTGSPGHMLEVAGATDINGILSVNDPAASDEEFHIASNGGSSDTAISIENNGNTFELSVKDNGLFGIRNASESHYLTINSTTGNVGIGTTSPETKLEVDGNINVTTGNDICIQGGQCLSNTATGGTLWTNSSGNATYTDGNVGIGTNFPSAKLQVTGEIWAFDDGNNNRFLFGDSGSTGKYGGMRWHSTNDYLQIFHSNTTQDQITLQTDGKVGIGTGSPNSRLGVVASSGDLITASNSSETVFKVNNTGGAFADNGFSTPAADLAEKIPVNGMAEPGDVLVIDSSEDETLKKSAKAYDRLAAGIVSTDPGLRLGEEGEYVALAGRVPVKVTGAVTRGDLLTTSDEPGKAMACDDYEKCAGAIVGKAMTNSEGGMVTALVSLQ